jgi:hypothetical protein
VGVVQRKPKDKIVYMRNQLMDMDADIFPVRFCASPPKESKPNEIFLQAEKFLKKINETNQVLIENIDNLLMFNDIDGISDVMDEHQCTLSGIGEEMEFCRKNPYDLFYEFEPHRGKPKFRRYAYNKRTYEKFGKIKIR